MKEEELQDSIDNYLLGKMSPAEENAFETDMQNDADLQQKVEIQKLIVDEIRNRAAFNKIVDATQKSEKRHIKFRRTMTVIWSAAAIFIGVFFVNNVVQNSRMDNIYNENFSIPQANMLRGDDPIEQAVKLLENDQPKQAQIILESLYNSNSISVSPEDVRWYLALTELKLHNKSNARKYFKELKGSYKYGKKAEEIMKKLS